MLWGATKCRINEPSAPKSCQDLQYKRPCDNGKNEYYSSLSKIDLEKDMTPFVMFIEKRIIHTMIELHQYLFINEFEEDNMISES